MEESRASIRLGEMTKRMLFQVYNSGCTVHIHRVKRWQIYLAVNISSVPAIEHISGEDSCRKCIHICKIVLYSWYDIDILGNWLQR